MRKWIASLLCCSLLSSSISPVWAQMPAMSDSAMARYAACRNRGLADGHQIDENPAFTGGVVGGLFLGLIGMGIAWAVQTEPEPDFQPALYHDPVCTMAYNEAFGKAGKQRKQSAAISGGLWGTAIFVGILVAATHEPN